MLMLMLMLNTLAGRIIFSVVYILPQNKIPAFNPIKRPNCPLKTKYKHHREGTEIADVGV